MEREFSFYPALSLLDAVSEGTKSLREQNAQITKEANRGLAAICALSPAQIDRINCQLRKEENDAEIFRLKSELRQAKRFMNLRIQEGAWEEE